MTRGDYWDQGSKQTLENPAAPYCRERALEFYLIIFVLDV